MLVLGYLKDLLAPGCKGGDDDDGAVAASDACRDDETGLRWTLFIMCVWMCWFPFFSFFTIILSRIKNKK